MRTATGLDTTGAAIRAGPVGGACAPAGASGFGSAVRGGAGRVAGCDGGGGAGTAAGGGGGSDWCATFGSSRGRRAITATSATRITPAAAPPRTSGRFDLDLALFLQRLPDFG